jgi:hypothetical protein
MITAAALAFLVNVGAALNWLVRDIGRIWTQVLLFCLAIAASYVALINGIVRPMCANACYERYLERCALREDLERRERATRITGSFEDGFVVEDRMPSEIYA